MTSICNMLLALFTHTFFRKILEIRCIPTNFSKKQLWQKCGYDSDYLSVW